MNQLADQFLGKIYPLSRVDLSRIELAEQPANQRELLSVMLFFVNGIRKAEYPYVLPVVDYEDKSLSIYVVDKDLRSFHRVSNELSAFLGSSRVTGDYSINTNAESELEQVLLEFSPKGFIKISLLQEYSSKTQYWLEVLKTLQTYLEISTDRPRLVRSSIRPIGRVLRDFYTAVLAENHLVATELLPEIRQKQALTTRNMHFLEVLALRAGRKWNEILSRPDIPDLVGPTTPRSITNVILESIGNSILRNVLHDPGSVKTLDIGEFRSKTEHVRSVFMYQPRGFTTHYDAEAVVIWAIGAAAHGYSVWSKATEVGLNSQWDEAIRNWSGRSIVVDDGSKKVFSLQVNDVSDAEALLQRMLFSNQEDAAVISEELVKHGDLLDQIAARNPHLKTILIELSLTEDEHDESIDGWNNWFSSAVSQKDSEKLLKTAQSQHEDWSIKSIDEVKLTKALDDISDTGDSTSSELIRNVTPLFLKDFEDWHGSLSASAWLKFSELLALDDLISNEDLVLINRLVEKVLTASHTKEQYFEVIDHVSEIWNKQSSIASLPVMMDLIDTLIDLPCPDDEARQKLWREVETVAIRYWGRLKPEVIVPLRLIASDLFGTNDHLPKLDDDSENLTEPQHTDLVNGKLLGVYWLMEPGARRVKTCLEASYPGLTVTLNQDTVATEALMNLARKSDYFMINTNHAAHAATMAIEDIRKKDFMRPRGRGASSMIATFIELVESLV